MGMPGIGGIVLATVAVVVAGAIVGMPGIGGIVVATVVPDATVVVGGATVGMPGIGGIVVATVVPDAPVVVAGAIVGMPGRVAVGVLLGAALVVASAAVVPSSRLGPVPLICVVVVGLTVVGAAVKSSRPPPPPLEPDATVVVAITSLCIRSIMLALVTAGAVAPSLRPWPMVPTCRVVVGTLIVVIIVVGSAKSSKPAGLVVVDADVIGAARVVVTLWCLSAVLPSTICCDSPSCVDVICFRIVRSLSASWEFSSNNNALATPVDREGRLLRMASSAA